MIFPIDDNNTERTRTPILLFPRRKVRVFFLEHEYWSIPGPELRQEGS